MIDINKTQFTNEELKLFTHLITSKEKQVLSFLSIFLQKRYDKVEITNDYIVAIGNIPIALAAHIDIVHPESSQKELFYDTTKGVLWSPNGLGADDRAGIFIILEILKKGYRPTIIFTTGEERGGIGATQLIKKHPAKITELNYIIELDRRGSTDCVFYECENPEFEKYIEKFGFITQWGTYTDICEICPKWGMAGVNLSVGYEHEHTYSEILRVSWLKSTMNKVIKMLEDINNSKFFKYIPGNKWDWYSNYYGSSYSFDKYQYRCKSCQGIFDYCDVVKVKNSKDGNTYSYYCVDCLDGGIGYCDICEELYQLEEGNKEHNLCPTCRKKLEKEITKINE